LEAAGATGVSVDFTLPDLVDALAAGALPLEPARIDGVRAALDAKDAGGLREAGGADYLPLLYAAGPFDASIERLAAIDAGGALAGRIAALREIAGAVPGAVRVTLDPTERHGFEYQSWFGFSLYAEGVRGLLGRGGTYTIHGTEEQATGFSLYIDPLIDALGEAPAGDLLYLPLGHDPQAAARLRSAGWRTLAALAEGESPAALGCTHALDGDTPAAL
ncbi:MAG: ATP phosphoribosyltransferase regulatory subunit, partial [Tsuneonella sp.]